MLTKRYKISKRNKRTKKRKYKKPYNHFKGGAGDAGDESGAAEPGAGDESVAESGTESAAEPGAGDESVAAGAAVAESGTESAAEPGAGDGSGDESVATTVAESGAGAGNESAGDGSGDGSGDGDGSDAASSIDKDDVFKQITNNTTTCTLDVINDDGKTLKYLNDTYGLLQSYLHVVSKTEDNNQDTTINQQRIILSAYHVIVPYINMIAAKHNVTISNNDSTSESLQAVLSTLFTPSNNEKAMLKSQIAEYKTKFFSKLISEESTIESMVNMIHVQGDYIMTLCNIHPYYILYHDIY